MIIVGVKDQLIKIKDNWLLIAAVLLLFIFLYSGGVRNISYSMDSVSQKMGSGAMYESADYNLAPSYASNGDFAPDVEERKITRSVSLSSEVERGAFQDAEQSLKAIVSSSDSFILSENVNRYGTDRKEYFQGSYQLKVDTAKYDSVLSQLKGIGEVQSFNENTQDVTGTYTNTELNLETEKSRLARYQQMYDEAKDVEDKININDRIFDEERRIKYMEDSLKNIDQRIDYSTVYFTMTEKRSEYADIAMVKLSSLVKDFVGSFNALLTFLFTVFPWAVVVLIGAVAWRFFRRRA